MDFFCRGFPIFADFIYQKIGGPTGPQLLAPAVGWCAVHNGALRAPAAMLYTMGPFRPPLRVVLRSAAAWRCRMTKKKKQIFWQPTKKKQKNFFFFQNYFLLALVPVAGAGAGDADPKNKKYIAIPFICHLRERSVTTQS